MTEIDQSQIGQRAKPSYPTVILQVIEGRLTLTTGPHPVLVDEQYGYDWDLTWNEPGTEVITVQQIWEFRKADPNLPVMVQRCLDEHQDAWEHRNDDALGCAMFGQYILEVLDGRDPR